MKNCDRGLKNSALGRRPRAAAYSSPMLQCLAIRTDLRRTITCLSFFFLVVNWLTSGFVYATFSLYRLTCLQQTIRKNLTSERASNSDTKQRKLY